MRRALTLALCLTAADAGLRIGKPSGAGALKMATREEEKKAGLCGRCEGGVETTYAT